MSTKPAPTDAWAEAVARTYQLPLRGEVLVADVVKARTVRDRALALSDLLDYLGHHPKNRHPAPRAVRG